MGRTFACTDFHGIKENYDKINAFLNEDDKVYFLGDAADRGPDGWAIIKDLIDRPNWVWIMGNHDKMLVDRLLYPDKYDSIALHVMNGGVPTWDAIEIDKINYRPEFISNIAQRVSELPLTAEYINKDGKVIYMSHSGAISDNPDEVLWDRTHFITKISTESHTIDYIIHGHTPISYLVHDLEEYNWFLDPPMELDKNSEPHAYWYREHTKCDLDCLTVKTGCTVLLDLDTFEEHLFKSEVKN